MKAMNLSARLFIGAMAMAGVAAVASGLMQWECKDPVRFLSFLIMAAIASRLKVKLPGTNGNMSVNLPFILLAVASLSFPEAVVLAAVSAFVQSLPRSSKLNAVQALFNLSTLLLAASGAYLAYSNGARVASLAAQSLLVALAGAAFLLADTLPVAAVISLTENLNLAKVWLEVLELTFSYFALSTGVAAIAVSRHYVGWRTPLLMLPVMIGAYVSYKRYFRLPAIVAVKDLQFVTLPAGAREKAEVQH